VGAAADLIQLNRMCFNGLYRENQDGHFNVAMDPGKLGCDLVREELLTACSEALQGTPIHCLDFRVSIARAGRGDVVWFDSPYWPGPDTKGRTGLFGAELRPSFTAYTAAGFGSQDHHDALEALQAARERGAWVLSTNAWEDGWVGRYRARGFQALPFEAGRPIACTQEGRATVSEVLFIGVPLA
jgi:site-specific DNA-adenine methylase